MLLWRILLVLHLIVVHWAGPAILSLWNLGKACKVSSIGTSKVFVTKKFLSCSSACHFHCNNIIYFMIIWFVVEIVRNILKKKTPCSPFPVCTFVPGIPFYPLNDILQEVFLLSQGVHTTQHWLAIFIAVSVVSKASPYVHVVFALQLYIIRVVIPMMHCTLSIIFYKSNSRDGYIFALIRSPESRRLLNDVIITENYGHLKYGNQKGPHLLWNMWNPKDYGKLLIIWCTEECSIFFTKNKIWDWTP